MDFLDDLPIEIILVILSHLNFHSLMALSETSKKYYFLIHEEILSGQLSIDLELDYKHLKHSSYLDKSLKKDFEPLNHGKS